MGQTQCINVIHNINNKICAYINKGSRLWRERKKKRIKEWWWYGVEWDGKWSVLIEGATQDDEWFLMRERWFPFHWLNSHIFNDLHHMKFITNNWFNNPWSEDNVLIFLGKIVPNKFESSNIHNPLQSLWASNWRLVCQFCDMAKFIISIILGNMHTPKLKIEHCTKAFVYHHNYSKVINHDS